MPTFSRTIRHHVKLLLALLCCTVAPAAIGQTWVETLTVDGSVVAARHESGSVTYNGYIYTFGGRGNRPVNRYNPTSNTWETVAQMPLEMHHFQPVVLRDKIYILGAMICCYPIEPSLADIYEFDPATNAWSIIGEVPAERLRGSAATVVHNNKIYLVGGNTLGHSGGAVSWFDEYDPASGNWTALEDAPNARDHLAAVIIDNKLIAASGRQSNIGLSIPIAATDIYDFSSQSWSSDAHDIPTERAGAMAVRFDDKMYVVGGESLNIPNAHSTVEVFSPDSGTWRALEAMITPRHAGGAAMLDSRLHVFAGSTTRGGAGETSAHESIDLALAPSTALPPTPPVHLIDSDEDQIPDVRETDIYGTDPNNPDTDGDGVNDYQELFNSSTDPNQKDTDGDGLEDLIEINSNLDPNNTDTDGDGLTDGDEINRYQTEPANADSDNDGVNDGLELLQYSTDPWNSDTDSDTLSDGLEINELNSNPLAQDTDSDELTDGAEYNIHGTSPTEVDTDNDGLKDKEELFTYQTNPLNSDSDGDFLSDGNEVILYKSNPLSEDTDGDGINDNQEVASGSSLSNTDQDNDGLINSTDGTQDSDLDGIPNYADLDSDNDTIPDLIELGYHDIDRDGQLDSIDSTQSQHSPIAASNQVIDTDEDGIPDYLDLDSDQDGIPDIVEASANYQTTDVQVMELVDLDVNGLDDGYNNAIIPIDTDGDLIPDYLDLDSDGDGFNDTVESGSIDEDSDGIVDDQTDSDGDGIADNSTPRLGASMPDKDGDDIPDVLDSKNSRFGCSIGSTTTTDPVLPLLLLLSTLFLHRRKLQIKH